MKHFFYLLLLLCSSCALKAPTQRDSLARQEETEFQRAEIFLSQGKAEDAFQAFGEFQKKFPQSGFFDLSRIRQAECLENLGRPQESLVIYRSVVLKTEKLQPEIAAMAMYRMASAYEALGEDLKMSAALIDAQARGQFLPEEVSRAQIPARLAAVYARQGEKKESMRFLLQADDGLNTMIQSRGRNIDKEWLARIYFEMGNSSTNQLSVGNFEDFIESQKVVQVYMLRSMKLDQKTWSERSQIELQRVFRDLLAQLESVKKNPDLKARLAGSFIELIDQADRFRPLSDESATKNEESFFTFLEVVRRKTDEAVFGNSLSIPLTEESEKLNGLRREGRIKPNFFLPEELNSVINESPKIGPTVDPNL